MASSADLPTVEGLCGHAQRRPVRSRLSRTYEASPSWLRTAVRELLGRAQARPYTLHRYLTRFDAIPPSSRPGVLLLTHDVDTVAGLDALPRLLEIEERLGLSSLSLLVTHRFEWDPACLGGWRAGGFLFGVHDTRHDNRLPYLAVADIRGRLQQGLALLGPHGVRAFRSPSFLRSASLYEALEGVIDFDLSAPDSALLWPHPGDGLQSPFPVRFRGVVCIPTTLPRDGELRAFASDGAKHRAIVLAKAARLSRIGAPAVLLTHPDPGFTHNRRDVEQYRTLLEELLSSGRFEVSTPVSALERIRADAAALV